MDVAGEPLALDASAQLNEVEGNEPMPFCLAVAPNTAEARTRHMILAGNDSNQLIVVGVINDEDDERGLLVVPGLQHPPAHLLRL